MHVIDTLKPGLRICPICGSEYRVRPHWVHIKRGYTCSRKCSRKWKSDRAKKKPIGRCIINGCPYIGSLDIGQYCPKHYQYNWRYGFPEIPDDNFPPLNISFPDREWVAAAIDCEGWVGLMKNPRKTSIAYWPVIGVGNTDKHLIDELIRRTGVGRIGHSPRPYPAKNLWTWMVSKRDEVLPLCLALLPNLILKRRQARLLLMVPKKNERAEGRRARIQKLLKRLNRKGCRRAHT